MRMTAEGSTLHKYYLGYKYIFQILNAKLEIWKSKEWNLEFGFSSRALVLVPSVHSSPISSAHERRWRVLSIGIVGSRYYLISPPCRTCVEDSSSPFLIFTSPNQCDGLNLPSRWECEKNELANALILS